MKTIAPDNAVRGSGRATDSTIVNNSLTSEPVTDAAATAADPNTKSGPHHVERGSSYISSSASRTRAHRSSAKLGRYEQVSEQICISCREMKED